MVGLSYEPTCVKGVILQAGSRGIRVLRSFQVFRQEDGSLPLDAALKREGAKGLPCHLAFPRYMAAVRYLDMPPLDPTDLSGALRYESGSHFPYDLEEAYWDGKPSARSIDSMRVAICAVKRDVLDRLLRDSFVTFPRIETVTVSSFALHAAYLRVRGQAGWGSALIADISFSGLSMAICHEDELCWCRGVNRPGNAENTGTWEAFEILRSIETLQRKQLFPVPDRILVCGNQELAERVEAVLKEDSRRNLGYFNPFLGFKFLEPMEASDAPEYAVSIGAALAGSELYGIPINLMPKPEPVTLKSTLTPQNLVQTGYLAVAFFLFLILSLIVNITFKEKRLREVEAELMQHWPIAERSRILQREVMELRRRSELVRSVEREWTTWLDVLAELYMIIPDEAVTVDRIELSGNKLDDMSCRATSATALMNILEDSLYFEEVVPKGKITTEENGLERFSLAAKLTRKEL